MYERFTDRARNVFILANQEAQRLNHEYIGTEHILLGLIKEGSGVAAKVLENLNIDMQRIRLEVKKIMLSGPSMLPMGKLPMMSSAKKVVEYSMEESRNINHDYIGTEHIMLGLLRARDGVAAQVMAIFGLEVDRVREEIKSVLIQPYDWRRKKYPHLPTMQSVKERFLYVEPPAACPKCGEAQVVRILWGSVHLFGKNKEDIAAGKAILGSLAPVKGPPWVCLKCAPAWREVHRLTLQDEELEIAKENAVASQDFETAVKYRDAQSDLRIKRDSLLVELLRNQ